MDSKPQDFRAMMEQYNRELLRMQQLTTAAQPSSPPPVPPSFTAPLQVRVTSANEAIPIPDALVIVTRKENEETIVEGGRITNQSGLTEPLLLAAIDPALTLQPGNTLPPIAYEVSVSAPAYYRAVIRDIPLYGGIPTELPVSLVPLPEFTKDSNQEIQYSTPPINL